MIFVLYCSSTSMITIMSNLQIQLFALQVNGRIYDRNGNIRVAKGIRDTKFETICEPNRRANSAMHREGGPSGLEKGKKHGMTFLVPKEHRRKCERHLWIAILPNTNHAFILEVRPCQQCRTDYVQEWTDDMFYGEVMDDDVKCVVVE